MGPEHNGNLIKSRYSVIKMTFQYIFMLKTDLWVAEPGTEFQLAKFIFKVKSN